VRRAGWDDEDITLRDRDILSPDGGCAGATLAVALTDGPALPIRDLAAKLHVALAFEDVVNLRHVIVNGIVWVLLTLVTVHDADTNLMIVAPTARLDHVHGNIGELGANHVFLVRLYLRGRNERSG